MNNYKNKQIGSKTPTKRKPYNTKQRVKESKWRDITAIILLVTIGVACASIYSPLRALKAQQVQFIKLPVKVEVEQPVEENEELDIKQRVMAMVDQAGLDPFKAYMIIQCESGWNPEAMNTKNTNGSFDSGLWQINSIHKNITNSERLNPIKATQWSITKRLNDGNWSAWVCSRKLGIR